MRWNANRVAAASFADRRHINRGTAVPAHDVLPVLAIPFRAADAARVKGRAVTVRLLDDHEAQRLSTSADRKQMHLAVLYVAHRNAHFVAHRGDGPRGGWRGIHIRINK